MNLRKKVLAGLLGVTMLGGMLAGCGQEAKSDEIKIGANFEITGNVANYGGMTLEGLKLAIKQANDAGGVNGKKITLVVADTKSEASEAANSATKLISTDKVKVLVGPSTTSNVLATTQIATENKIPLIAPTGTSPKITVENGQVKPYIFRSCFIDPLQGEVMATFASKTLKAKTAAVYMDSSSDYSKSLAQVFKEKFEAAGGKVVLEEAFFQKDQDFKATLTKIKGANADVIFIPAYYEEVGKIVKQARELGINSPMLGTDGWDDAKVVDIAGAGALNNTFFSTHYSEQDSEVQGFVEAFKAEYNKAPNVFAALGYDAGKMLIDAIKRAGSDDPEKIRQALEETKDLQVGTGMISIDKNHDPIKSAVIIEMKNGIKTMKEKIMPQG
ncbi:MAG: ABC transporter substrate-binding protein [Selenomonadaceae bacterium]|jgi:branched-chain amino acid transport system substrate-binding protein